MTGPALVEPVRVDAVQARPWLRCCKVVVLILAVVIPAVEIVRALKGAHGDFPNHCISASRYVHGTDIYAGGLNSPYPPFWAMAFSPFTLLPTNISQALLLVVGVGAFYFLLWMLSDMTREAMRLPAEWVFWPAALAGLIAVRFVVRDFDEAGPNLILVTLSWFSIWLWRRGRDVVGGVPIGLAIALKCTPLLMVAYFGWKRQWKFVLSALAATAFFAVLPAVHQGPKLFGREAAEWWGTVRGGVSQKDPSVGVLGPETVQNKSLRPALARYLMHVPPPTERPIRWGYVYFLDLPPRVAGLVIKGLMAIGLLAVAWRFRSPVGGRRDVRVLWEAAAVLLLMLLYSPITWGQHCVAILPGLYLVLRTWARDGRLPTPAAVGVAAFAFLILVPNRSTLGTSPADLLETYHYVTFALVILLTVVLALRPSNRADGIDGAAAA